jgi:hypothetical protein
MNATILIAVISFVFLSVIWTHYFTGRTLNFILIKIHHYYARKSSLYAYHTIANEGK